MTFLASFTIEREIMEVDEMMLSFPLHQFRVVKNPDILGVYATRASFC